MSVYLQTKSWEEAREAIKKSKGVAIVPIGSVEQHSYHLPLGTVGLYLVPNIIQRNHHAYREQLALQF